MEQHVVPGIYGPWQAPVHAVVVHGEVLLRRPPPVLLLGCASARGIIASVVSISTIVRRRRRPSQPPAAFSALSNSSSCSLWRSSSMPCILFSPCRDGHVRRQSLSLFHSPFSYCDGDTVRSTAVPRNRPSPPATAPSTARVAMRSAHRSVRSVALGRRQ
jgi:hypothetical protein